MKPMVPSSPQKTDSRTLAYRILNKVELQGSYANLALDASIRKNKPSPQDTGFLTELVYGTIRQKRYLDWILNQFSTEKNTILPIELQNIFRLGLYQIFFLGSVPDYAIVSQTVEMAKDNDFQAKKDFVNGVLRNILRKRALITLPSFHKNWVQAVGIRYSHPDWIVKLYEEKYGRDVTIQLCEFNNNPAPIVLRVNTLKIKIEDFGTLLKKFDIEFRLSLLVRDAVIIDSKISVERIPGYKDGYFHIQDEASQLIGNLVSPMPGQSVLDLCAAPGGKALHLAQLMDNEGLIMAVDINDTRLKMLQKSREKLGISIIKTLTGDATQELHHSPRKFDIVLLDAPCSGLGVLRRKVDARWRKRKEDIRTLLKLQSNLLDNALKYLSPNGFLVYSTCTLTKEENEHQMAELLKRHNELEIVSAKQHLSEFLSSAITPEGFLSTLPPREKTDGMFACKLRFKS